MPVTSSAEIVIVGGGAVGCGAALALARAGKTDVLVIEREDDLGKVTTSQGAGLAGQVRSSIDRTRLAMHSVATFRELERDPDVRPDWRPVGSLRIAETEARVRELERLEQICRQAGLGVERLDPAAAARACPLLDLREAKAVLRCATDGYMTPASVVRAYHHQASKLGVRFETGTSLRALTIRNGRIEGVETSRGRVECRWAINAAGAHAHHVAKLAGIDLPIIPVRHEYFVSVPLDGITPDLPCLRFPDSTLYARPENGGFLLGGWEEESRMTDPRSYGIEGSPPPIDPDWPVLRSFADRLAPFFPRLRDAEVRRVGKGWPTFTPDGRFIIGESRRVPGFVMAGGCNAHGISGSAGIGKLLAESLLESRPSGYVRSLSPDRFTESTWDWETAARQAQRVYETYYALEGC